MKILLYIFLTTAIIAQKDSISTSIQSSDLAIAMNYNSVENTFAHSILEMKLNRRWLNSKSSLNSGNKLKTITFKEQEPNFIDTELFYISVGSALIFGATAAYFKLESDKAYEKYQITKQKSYLDKTDRYDVYSGLALGALEINFGFLIYKFLTD